MYTALKKAQILLPRSDIDLEKWAVIACDQFTGQPEYWRQAEQIVGDAPSTLRLTLPEAYLSESGNRVPAIQQTMRDYLAQGVLEQAVDGFVLVERTTPSGIRPGLVAALDLECYDPAAGSASLIRPTEGTVPERVPPRARIRAGAALELPHVLMLLEDPAFSVIEPLWQRRDSLRRLYDFDLMLDGGHLQGWAVEGADADGVFEAVERLAENCGGLLYSVGDGNHSLAAAKKCWMDIRGTLTEEERERHPARWALVELVNLECPALTIEPIHRILYDVDSIRMIAEFRAYASTHGIYDRAGEDLILFGQDASISFSASRHPLLVLQPFLDDYLARHPEVSIDYIHGADALKQLVQSHPGSLAIQLRGFGKVELFNAIRERGALPRKTFSMGEATEKRYYMEARKIVP